jgi:tetratricopeptide (TPR) repeat protein
MELMPNDPEIHCYEGHLLFESGLFVEAIQAYDKGVIVESARNYDVFLTRAKTYFLLGQFESSLKDMQVAYSLNSGDPGVMLDIEVIGVLNGYFQGEAASRAEDAEKAKKMVEEI